MEKTMAILQIILILLLCYLIGSLPTAYFVTLLVSKINIFEVGSGNMGGTNVARTIGLHWGVFTAFLDTMKGTIAVLLSRYIVAGSSADFVLLASMLGGLAAVAGHNWSLFATYLFWHYNKKFEIHGGKGGATAFGTTIALFPLEAWLMLLIIGVILAVITRYASLSVLTGFAVCMIYTIGWAILSLQQNPEHIYYIPYCIALSVLIVWRFRENIQRLLAGNERKLGERVA
jgi:acyl phosphate:glycerol-3-phosphate acyltransferase